MSLHQFRTLYPEYDQVSNDAICRKINALFWPEFEYAIIAKNMMEGEDRSYATMIFRDLYEKRGDTYLNAGDFKRGSLDFARIFKGIPEFAESTDRWRSLGKAPDGEYFLDVKSVEFPASGPVRLWIK